MIASNHRHFELMTTYQHMSHDITKAVQQSSGVKDTEKENKSQIDDQTVVIKQ